MQWKLWGPTLKSVSFGAMADVFNSSVDFSYRIPNHTKSEKAKGNQGFSSFHQSEGWHVESDMPCSGSSPQSQTLYPAGRTAAVLSILCSHPMLEIEESRRAMRWARVFLLEGWRLTGLLWSTLGHEGSHGQLQLPARRGTLLSCIELEFC